MWDKIQWISGSSKASVSIRCRALVYVTGDVLNALWDDALICLNQIVIRRLPPSLTKEELEEQLQPLPDVDYLEFFTSDTRSVLQKPTVCGNPTQWNSKRPSGIWSNVLLLPSLYPHLFARAYLNFKNQEDIVLFRDRFDGYVFIDNRGLLIQFAFYNICHRQLFIPFFFPPPFLSHL